MARRRAGTDNECTPEEAQQFIEKEWSREGVSVAGLGQEHIQLQVRIMARCSRLMHTHLLRLAARNLQQLRGILQRPDQGESFGASALSDAGLMQMV